MFLDSPTKKPRSLKEEIAFQKLRSEYLSAIIDVAHDWLYTKSEAKHAYTYLLSRVPIEYHKDFKFGYFPNDINSIYDFMDDLVKVLPKHDPKDVLELPGIIEFRKRRPKLFYYNNPLLFPYYNMYGSPISIVGRTLLPEKEMKEREVAKYKNLPFHRSFHLYGLNLTKYNILK